VARDDPVSACGDLSLIDGKKLPVGAHVPWIKPISLYTRNETAPGDVIRFG
jgi:hypothetical protein